MAKSVANVNIATDSFASWIEITNQMAYLFTNRTLTANASPDGDTVTGNSDINGIFAGNTIVAKDYLRGGNVTTNGVLTIVSNTNFSTPQINATANVYVTNGNTYFDSDIFYVLGGFANVTSNVHVAAANIYFTPDILTVAGNTINSTANVFLRNQLTVNGAVTIANTLATGNTTVTGFINVSSTANVGGATTLRSTLTVNGAATIANTLATGNTSVTGFINVSSTANVGGATTLRDTLTVNGAVTIANTLATGNTSVTGFINVSTTANVGGATTLRSTLIVNGAVTVDNTAVITGITTFKANNEYGTSNDVVMVVVANGNLGANITSAQTVMEFAKATYKTAKITAQAANNTAAGVEIQELILAQDTTDAVLTVYGTVAAPTSANVGVFSAAINTDNVAIRFTQTAANSSVKLFVHLIK